MTTEDLDEGREVVRSPLERSRLVARALGEAARRARFSTRGRRARGASGFAMRRGERLMRLVVRAGFVVIVVVPTLVGAIYYGLIASDQYVSETRFALRGGTAPKLDALGALTGFPSLQIIQDTEIVIEYLQSRGVVEALQARIDLVGMFSRPDIDYFSRLDPEEPIEKIVRYWKRMLEVKVQLPAGIVVIDARAFTPSDAVTIARALLEEGERLVNEINARIRRDNLALTEVEQIRARDRLAKARAAVEQARNEEGLLSAEKALESQNVLIVTERARLLAMQEEYETQRRYLAETSPQLRALKKRIDATEEQIERLKAELTRRPDTSSETKVLSGVMTRLHYLDYERLVAEKSYASALEAHERARQTSEAQLLYINTFVRPLEPQQPRYPRRLLVIGLVFGISSSIWGLLIGTTVLVRNNMAR